MLKQIEVLDDIRDMYQMEINKFKDAIGVVAKEDPKKAYNLINNKKLQRHIGASKGQRDLLWRYGLQNLVQYSVKAKGWVFDEDFLKHNKWCNKEKSYIEV